MIHCLHQGIRISKLQRMMCCVLWHISSLIAVFVLKRDVKLQPTNSGRSVHGTKFWQWQLSMVCLLFSVIQLKSYVWFSFVQKVRLQVTVLVYFICNCVDILFSFIVFYVLHSLRNNKYIWLAVEHADIPPPLPLLFSHRRRLVRGVIH